MTNENYSMMSDLEINDRIRIIEGISEDYCNNWGAIGYLIQSCKISVTPYMDRWWRAARYDFCYVDANPCRAIAIVFLMWHDSKHGEQGPQHPVSPTPLITAV